MDILSIYGGFDNGLPARVAEVVPGANVRRLRPDDAGFSAAWAQAEVFVGWPVFKSDDPALQPGAAANLRWVQATSAGIASIKGKVPGEWIVTSAAGVYGHGIAEHVIGMLLFFRRHLGRCAQAQQQGHWGIGDPPFRELEGRTLLMLGLGDIGQHVATRASAFGLRVVGVRRHVGRDRPPGVERVVGMDALDEELPGADIVVAALPGTRHTRGLFDATRFARMKDDAGFINVGRGSLVDQDALADWLTVRSEAWAALDVTHPEPLPAEHALWTLPNVLITPHIGGRGDHNAKRMEALFLENLRRYAAGDIEAMRNRFDPEWEY